LNGSGTGHRYSPNPPWPLTGGSGAYAGATGSVLTRDIAGRDEAVTDSVGVVTVTAKHRLKVGVVPRPSANRPFVARADAVCTSSQAKLSTLPPFPVSNFDPWHPDPTALPAGGHFFAEPARRALEEQLQHNLVGLGQPPADLADWARFLRDRAQTLTLGQAQIKAALDADVAGFVRTVEEDDALNRKITIDAGIVGAESCTFF
jgi:hypothetical protein